MAEEKTYVFGEGAGNGILGLLGPMYRLWLILLILIGGI